MESCTVSLSRILLPLIRLNTAIRHSWQRPRPKHKKGSETEQEAFIENLPNIFKKVEEENPEAEIDLWFFDEHRLGLKPILRKVWSPIGERPTAIVNHRYEWLMSMDL